MGSYLMRIGCIIVALQVLVVVHSYPIHLLIVGIEGSGHHTVINMMPPGWAKADWSPEIFLNETGGYVTNAVAMGQVITTR